MKQYPHKTDEEIIREGEQSSREFIEGLQPELNNAKANKNAVFFKLLGQEIVFLGQYAYAFEKTLAEVLKHLKQAAVHLARAIDYELVMDVFEYMDYLSVAVVANDVKFAQRLASLQRTAYTNEDVDASEVSFVAAQIVASLVLARDQELTAAFKLAEHELQAKKTGRYDKLVMESLIAISRAIVERNQAQFDQALAAREKDFKRLHGAPDERDRPESLLDIKGLCLVRLAIARGLRYQTPSVYRPAELLQVKS